jgi:hypothetical protein
MSFVFVNKKKFVLVLMGFVLVLMVAFMMYTFLL